MLYYITLYYIILYYRIVSYSIVYIYIYICIYIYKLCHVLQTALTCDKPICMFIVTRAVSCRVALVLSVLPVLGVLVRAVLGFDGPCRVEISMLACPCRVCPALIIYIIYYIYYI